MFGKKLNLQNSEVYHIKPLITQIYGANEKYQIWVAHQLESLSIFSTPDTYYWRVLKFNQNLFNVKLLNQLKSFYLLLLLNLRLYRGFRLLFNLPSRGQRTWSNANTSKNTISILLELKYKKFNTYTYHKYTKTEVLAEYINFLWSCQWNLEWRSMRRNWIRHRNFRKKPLTSIKFDDIINFRMEHFSTKILALKKFKSHRKKIKFNKNLICGGFKFGFVYYYNRLFKPKLKCDEIYWQ